MNPYDEHKLRNEVIYLHSLWHQGPPLPPPPPSQPYTPQYYSHPLSFHHHHHHHHHHPAPARTRSLLPLPSTTFKKKHNNNRHNVANPKSNWAVSENPVWASTTQPTAWAEPKPKPKPSPPLKVSLSPQEKEKLAAIQAQNKACKALKEYLLSNHDHDGDAIDDDDHGDEKFEDLFVRMFLEDDELRGYYQRSYESGEFHCLVCNAIGKKNCGKKYKDCVALVQHSRSIKRTAKKWVHRGFGRAVCKVLGWDVKRLPAIVLKGKPLGLEMKQAQAEVESEVNNFANDDNKVMSLEHADVAVEETAQGVDQSISKRESAEKPDPSWAGTEWPSVVWPKTSPTTNWGVPKPGSAPPPEVSPAEKEKLAVMQAQNKACQALKDYLLSNHDDDGDGSEDDGHDDDDGEEFEDFFVRIFLEDHELRGYYQRSYESGEFCCLVCNAIGKKNSRKKYKDCAALVHHSISILRTAKKWVHRGFGHAVCKVLGWDVNRLPNLVMNGTPLGREMNSAQAEVESEANNFANDDDKVMSLENVDVAVEETAQGVDQSISKHDSSEARLSPTS